MRQGAARAARAATNDVGNEAEAHQKKGCAGRELCRERPPLLGERPFRHGKERRIIVLFRPFPRGRAVPRLSTPVLAAFVAARHRRAPKANAGGPVVGSGRRPRVAVAFAARCAANSWTGLFLLHLHCLFGALILGFGLLLAAGLGLVTAAASGLTRGTSSRPFGLGLSWHCSAPLR